MHTLPHFEVLLTANKRRAGFLGFYRISWWAKAYGEEYRRVRLVVDHLSVYN